MMLKFHFPYVAALLCAMYLTVDAGLINENVQSRGVMIGPSMRMEYNVTMRNDGRGSFKSFKIAIPPFAIGRSRIAVSSGVKSDILPLTPAEADDEEPNDAEFLSVLLDSPIRSGETGNFLVQMDILDIVTSVADEVKHLETPSYFLKMRKHFFSPYKTERQVTAIKFPSGEVSVSGRRSETEMGVQGEVLSMGPYENTEPLSEESFVAMYEDEKPLLKMELFKKKVSLSHWGAANVVEEVTVHNAGTKVTAFGRVDHMLAWASGRTVNSADGISVTLPQAAYDVFYVDLIGNVTSSSLRLPSKKGRLFEQTFRYPLVGGWKVFYWFGYTLPLSSTLKSRGSQHVIRVGTQPSTTEPIQVDKAILEVMLPEGAYDVNVHKVDVGLTELERNIAHPTLAYFGRKVVTLESTAALADGSKSAVVEISYKHSPVSLLAPIFVLFSGLFLIFAFMMVASRIDMRFVKDSEKEDTELSIYREVKQLVEVEEEHEELVEDVKDNIKGLTDKSGLPKYREEQSAVFNRMKSLEDDIDAVLKAISKLDPTEAKHADNISSTYKLLRGKLVELSSVASNLIEGKMKQKDAELKADKLHDAMDACRQKIDIAKSTLLARL